MEQNGDFKYFTGQETMQFAFIPVPMALLSDPRYENLSSDAKLLYALLLNRMNLSRKNGWFDEENRVFIYYSIEDIAADLHCGRNKAIKALQELDTESVMKKVISLWLQSWIISNLTVETGNFSGIVGTGSLYVSIIIM